jgi:V8-like Glu-specific endopeptidase
MFLVPVLRKNGLASACIIASGFVAGIPMTAVPAQVPEIAGQFKQPYIDATSSVREEAVDDSKYLDRGRGRYWTYTFSPPQPNSRYARIRFDRIHVPPDLQFTIQVVQLPSEIPVVKITRDQFAESESFFTNLLPSGDLRIELLSSSKPEGLSFRLERILWQAASTRATAESPILEFKSVQSLATTDPALQIAPSIALLHIGPMDATCTGALIDPGTVVTNNHCLDYSLSFLQSEQDAHPSCSDIVAEFDYLAKNQRGVSSKCISIRADKSLDAALITLDPATIRLQSGKDRAPIPIRPAAEGPPSSVSLMQYPLGLPLSLADGCSNKGIDQSDILHNCTSAHGSSGSPLLDERMQLAGLHYKGPYPDDWTIIQIENDFLQHGARYNRARLGALVSKFLNP